MVYPCCSPSEYLARRDDPMTSKVAAQKAVSFVASHEATIFAIICDRDRVELGCTAKEISSMLLGRLSDVQVNRRLGAMGKRSLIKRNCIGYVTHCNTGKVTEIYEQRDGCAVWRKA